MDKILRDALAHPGIQGEILLKGGEVIKFNKKEGKWAIWKDGNPAGWLSYGWHPWTNHYEITQFTKIAQDPRDPILQ